MTQRYAASPHLRSFGLACGLLALVPGAAPPAAGQNTTPVRIQEVLYDGSGTDSEEAFTEITGPPGKALTGWSLVGVNGSDGQSYRTISLDGATIPADGVLVVAHANATGAVLTHRDTTANVDWQNGPDAVQLLHTQGGVVDTVDALQYGDAGQHNAGEGSPAPKVKAGQSLSRSADGSDTDDNLTDFTAQDTPTPGTLSASPGTTTGAEASATGARLILPDTSAFYETRIDLPVRLTGAAGGNIVAVELFVVYDPGLLRAAPAPVTLSELTKDWVLEVNTSVGTGFNTLKIALASNGPALAGDGALVSLSFDTAGRRKVTTAPLYLTHALLNDGALKVSKKDGRLRWTGTTGTMEAEPALLFPGRALTLKTRDADENRDSLKPDSLTVRVRSGTDSERVTLTEVDKATGLFRGTLKTVRGLPAAGNDIIEVGTATRVTACYDDSLDAAGEAAVRCDSVSVGGDDGLLAVTAAAQPGDSLRILVTDPDLNLDPLAREQVGVQARRNAAGIPVAVTLREEGTDDSQFTGRLPVKLNWSIGALAVAGGDLVEVRYEDAFTRTGAPEARAGTTAVVGLFGDADGNKRLQTFDAARVLSHVLEPFLTGLDSLSTNVDAQAFDPAAGVITPLDASLILQHRVGLIARFPVQEEGSDNHPRIVSPSSKALDFEPRLALKVHPGHLEVWIDERSAAPSGSMLIEGVEGRVELDSALEEFLLDFRHQAGGTRIAFAGARPPPGEGELLRLYPDSGSRLGEARLTSVRLADRQVLSPGEGWPTAVDSEPAAPNRFVLEPNHPNPFNAGTVIPFQLATAGEVRLGIYNSLGQRVRILDEGRRSPGGLSHRLGRDGRRGPAPGQRPVPGSPEHSGRSPVHGDAPAQIARLRHGRICRVSAGQVRGAARGSFCSPHPGNPYICLLASLV